MLTDTRLGSLIQETHAALRRPDLDDHQYTQLAMLLLSLQAEARRVMEGAR